MNKKRKTSKSTLDCPTESVLAWLMLFIAVLFREPICFVASACYAVAAYMCKAEDRRCEREASDNE